MKITGPKTTINASAETVFSFLTKPANLELLLPEDKISDFKSDSAGCSFKAQGGITIPLIMTETIEPEVVKMDDGGKGPFSYELIINIKPESQHACSGHLEFDGDVNMFMKLLVERPLTNLFEEMTKKLQEHFFIEKL